MLAYTSTKINGDINNKLPKTLVDIKEIFCEGHGRGFIGKILKSPHKHLIGKTVKVDSRNKYFNLHAELINPKKNSFKIV